MKTIKFDDAMKESKRIHKVWHLFEKWLINNYGEKYHEKLIGYEVQLNVEKYIKTHPEIKISYCDDHHFSSSIMVLVPHFDMGTTIIFIPQNTTINNMFFLYPNHHQRLLENLKTMPSKVKSKY